MEKKLKGLGLFAVSAKREVREELSRVDQEIAEEGQKADRLKQEARKKAEETLEKHSRLLRLLRAPEPGEAKRRSAAPARTPWRRSGKLRAY